MAASKALPKRSEIPEADRWRLNDIYPSDQAFESDFALVKSRIPELEAYKGKLGESGKTLLTFLLLTEEIEKIFEKVYAYASLKKDEDSGNPTYQTLAGRAQGLAIEYSQATSFLVPEILSISAETLEGFKSEEKGLELYSFLLDDINRKRAHTLDVEKEKILAMAGEMAVGPRNIFNMLNDADLKFGNIKDENGDKVELTKGRYIQFLESNDRQVRQAAFETLYGAYGKQKNTLAAIINSSMKKDMFYAKVRNYESALASALHDDNVEQSVYDNLVNSVHSNLDKMHRYVSLRKKVLGVDELHFYDLYCPIVQDIKIERSFEEAKEMVLEALKPLGCEYLSTLKGAFDAGWVDIYENEGKASGAYSYGVYGVHPFVLLNYQGNLNDVFTLAHEMGHAMHSYYSQKAQPYTYAHYTIFVAEVASTLNEALMMHYLLDKTTDVAERKYLLNHYLEQFRGTLYRQTMFAEFEKITHGMVEAGEPLTKENLCDVYRKLNEQYFGPDIHIDEQIALEWCRIPHFYRAFYVYKYATGISAATALSLKILKEGQPAVDKYIEFLSGGGSDYPLNLLSGAGVDMRAPEPVDNALAVFGDLVAELEKLV